MHRIQGGGVILRNNKKRTLLLVLGKSSKKWSFPKGEKNEDETLIACARRETFEETGMVVSIPEKSLCVSFGSIAKRCYFLVDETSILSQSPSTDMKTKDYHEIQKVQWFHFDRAKCLPRGQVNRDVWCFLHPKPKEIRYYRWNFPFLEPLNKPM